MKTLAVMTRWFGWLFVAAGFTIPWTAGAALPAIQKGDVVVLPIHGPISEAQFFFLRRVVKQAESAEASAVILDIDTPGGALSATEKMCQVLVKSTVPVYSYVNTNAASAGALIAMATREIYMAPVSAIGAAAPVMGSGQEMGETMTAKVSSYYSGYFRSVAAMQGHNPDLVDAFMKLDKEVKVGDRVLNPKGAILTLSAQEAVEKIDGKHLLARAIAGSVGEVAREAGLNEAALVRVEPSGFESVAQLITTLAPLFLLGGMIGAWIEFKSPGFGVAGVLSGLCFLLFFAGHYVAGLTGFEVVAVFFLGVVLVLVELLFFPGVVVLAGAGVVLMLGSLLFAMVDYYPSQPLTMDPSVLLVPLANLSAAMILAVIFGTLLARFLPELPLFRGLVLGRSIAAGPSIEAPRGDFFQGGVSVGDLGVATTMLRPSGKGSFGDSLVDVVAEGEFLEAGTPLRVIRLGGGNVFVERAG
ncbi:MAG: NfeD family protein [Terrimicrobiaceae bacterium]